MEYIKIASTDEFANVKMKKYDHDTYEITIVKKGDLFIAFNDRCPHMNAPLHIGEFDGENIVCPLHKSKFSLTTGELQKGPTIPVPKFIKMGSMMHNIKTHDLHLYEVKIDGKDILVKLR